MDDPEFPGALRQLFFKELWENSPDNMFVVRREDGVFYIQSVNPSQARAVSIDRLSVAGKKLAEVFPLDLSDRFAVNYVNCLDGGNPLRYEEAFLNSDGLYTYWETFLIPVFTGNGREDYVYGICRDITPLRDAEQKLSELGKAAEQADKSKISFLANMSHEMRTPLNGITGAVSLFLETSDPEEKKELANIINSSVGSLSRITNDILDFARLNSGILRLELSEFSFRDLVHNVFQVVGPMISGKDISLMCNVSESVPDILLGDTIRIGQIMINVIGNAIKFTNQGEISVSARILEAHAGLVKLEISVHDTGIGIHEENIPHLFAPFSQIDGSSTRKNSGAGLGLAISRELAELMGGRITVNSSFGQGSVFKIVLPLKTSFAGRAHVCSAMKAETQDAVCDENISGVVLVVEDNHVNSMVASTILTKSGLEVIRAFNGREAIDCFLARPLDLILMDWHMPVMDGVDATKQIRKLPGGIKIPIIGLTANALDEHQAFCLEAGMNDVLTKPIDRSQMISKVRFWIGLSRGLP